MPLGECQSNMAELLGLSKAGYGHYDRGRQPFTIEQGCQLSRILGRSVEWLLGLETDLEEDEDQLTSLYRSAPGAIQEMILDVVKAMVGEG